MNHRAADEEDVKGIFPTRQRQSGIYPILFSFGMESGIWATSLSTTAATSQSTAANICLNGGNNPTIIHAMTAREQFLSEIEAFLAHTGMTVSEFGERAMNDRKFVGRLRAGGNVRLDTADRVRRFMTEYRPAHPTRRADARAVA